eukprot:9487194-Pyramimonas_sp.AAC.2
MVGSVYPEVRLAELREHVVEKLRGHRLIAQRWVALDLAWPRGLWGVLRGRDFDLGRNHHVVRLCSRKIKVPVNPLLLYLKRRG